MTDLMRFLTGKKATGEMVIDLGGRFVGQPFRIRSMEHEEYRQFQQQAISGGTFDQAKMNELLVLACCLDPDFTDVEFIEANGCRTPQAALRKIFNVGEINSLAKAISDLNGFNIPYTKLVEEVKN